MASPGPCVLLLLALSVAITTSQAQNGTLIFTGAALTSTGGYIYQVSVNQNYVVNQTILQANCSEMHSPSSQIQYSIFYAGDKFFTIHPKTGAVSLAVDGLDFPRDGNYLATIQCQSERVSEPLVAILQVSFTIQNEFTPVFNHSRSFHFSFREDYDTNVGTDILDLNATDTDRGQCGDVIYSIQSGNRMGTFRIDQSSGVLSFARSLDSDAVSDFTLQIIAGPTNRRRCRSPASPTANVVVTIHVEDINDTPPRFDQRVYSVSVVENAQPQNLLQVACSDPDSSSFLIYLIENFHSPFDIDQRTGVLSVKSALDYEERESYSLNVTCIDTQGASQVDHAMITVNVVPVNEFRPEIVYRGGFVTLINDDAPPGTLILSPLESSDALLSFRVKDRDRGLDHGDVKYTLTLIDEFARNYFYLNQSSGEITLIKQFDKTQCRQEGALIDTLDAHIQIAVCDINDTAACPTLSLQIFILPSECIPSFSQDRTQVYINESAPVGTEFASIPCMVDRADNRTVTIVSNEDSEIAETFALGSEDESLTLLKPLDYEHRQNYSFYLLCTNSYNSEALAEVEIVVTPDNDNPPFFDSPLHIFNVTLPIFSIPRRVGVVQARDDDRAVGGEITYTLTDFNKYFAVDNNGTVVINEIPPQSSNNNAAFVLEVRASDGKYLAETKVLILLSSVRASQLEGSSAEDDSSKLTVVLTTAIVFLGILLLLSCVLIVFLVVRSRRKLIQAEQKQSKIQDYSGGTTACQAYNVTCLTGEMAFNSSQYSEIKGGDGPEYAQLNCTGQRILNEPRSPTPQPYACPVPQYEYKRQTSDMGGYVPMQTVSMTQAEQDKDDEQETALEFGGMMTDNAELTSWRSAPTQTVSTGQDKTDEQETAVEFGRMVTSNGDITSRTNDGEGNEDEVREEQEMAEDDVMSSSNLEFGPPRAVKDNIYEHLQ